MLDSLRIFSKIFYLSKRAVSESRMRRLIQYLRRKYLSIIFVLWKVRNLISQTF